MLGYSPAGATAARAAVEFEIDAAIPDAVSIPSGYTVKTRDVTPPVEFRVVETRTIAPGQTRVAGTVENSQTHTQVFDTGNLPDQRISLVHGPYLDKSVSVRSGNSEFSEVASFLDSTPLDRHFVVLVGQDDRATLCFGNGAMGASPNGRLDVIYKTGGGTTGNVDAGSISILGAPLLDSAGKPIRASVNNPAAATGGSEREGIESIRQRAPASLRRAQRTITREDFESNACRVPGVARALMTTNHEDSLIPQNTGRLYIVPEGLGAANDELVAQVHRQVTYTYPCTLTFQVKVETPTYKSIDIEAELEAATPAQNIQPWIAEHQYHADPQNILLQQVTKNLQALFSLNRPDNTPNPRANFGFYLGVKPGSRGDVPWSEVVSAICSTAGVRKVALLHLNGAQQDVVLEPFEFPILGRVSLRLKNSAEVA